MLPPLFSCQIEGFEYAFFIFSKRLATIFSLAKYEISIALSGSKICDSSL